MAPRRPVPRRRGACARGLLLVLAILAVPPAWASPEQDALRQTLRGPQPSEAKLQALEAFGSRNGPKSLEFLDKKDLEPLHASVKQQLHGLAAAQDGLGALALWLRFLRALPSDKDGERLRRFLPDLHGPARLVLARASRLYEEEDYLGAWRLAAQVVESGAGLKAASELQSRASAAGDLAAKLDARLAQPSLSASDQALTELERLAAELARQHPGAAPRRVRAARALSDAIALYRSEQWEALGHKLDTLPALGVSAAALRRELEAEGQQPRVGGILRGVEAGPAPTRPAPAPTRRPVAAAAPQAEAPQPAAVAPDEPRPAVRRPTEEPQEPVRPPPAPPATRTPAPSPTPVPSPTPERSLPVEVVRRVREAAHREADFYRRALAAAGASAWVPRFRVEAVSIRGWSAEVHLVAGLEDPAAQVSSLLLPQAERQFLRLVAHKILEEAPELAGVEFHLALQNGRAAPVDLGEVRIDADLLKRTAGQDVQEFWKQLDARDLQSVWR